MITIKGGAILLSGLAQEYIYKDFVVNFRGIRMTNVLEDMFVKWPRVVLKWKILVLRAAVFGLSEFP